MTTTESIIRIPPYHYIHVLDQNSNVSRVEVGPKTYIRQDNERLAWGLTGHVGMGALGLLLSLPSLEVGRATGRVLTSLFIPPTGSCLPRFGW